MSIGINEQSKLITVKKVADILNVSQNTVRRIVNREEVKFYKVGKSIRFNTRDVERYLGSVEVGPVDLK